jgi:hypothetical protein
MPIIDYEYRLQTSEQRLSVKLTPGESIQFSFEFSFSFPPKVFLYSEQNTDYIDWIVDSSSVFFTNNSKETIEFIALCRKEEIKRNLQISKTESSRFWSDNELTKKYDPRDFLDDYYVNNFGERCWVLRDTFNPLEEKTYSFGFAKFEIFPFVKFHEGNGESIGYEEKTLLENRAQEFINPLLGLNFFPHGKGMDKRTVIRLDNEAVSLVAFYKENDGYTLRFVNNNENSENVCVTVMGQKFNLAFGKYEAKTYIYDGESLTEKEIWY